MSEAQDTGPVDPGAYVQQVMEEIAEEVRVRRASGDIPPRLERELDELFLAHAPIGVRGGDLSEALRLVDAATFIDPVVPVESERAAGAAVKKGMRTMLLWYVGWVTHQMSQSASAVSRALHIVDDHLKELERRVEAQRVPDAAVVEFPTSVGAGAWWIEPALAALAKAPGRVLHTACGDGWLVRKIVDSGVDAYGVDPRAPIVDAAELGALDLRSEPVTEHLRAVASAGLGGVVLSATVEGMAGGERTQLLKEIGTRLAPSGTLVIHSVGRASWDAADAPYGADLAPGRPLRADTWCRLLKEDGYAVNAQEGPDGGDYLITAVRSGLTPYEHGAPGAR